MPNQVVIPSTGAGAAASPQPFSLPFASGHPAEGPLSALVFLTIPQGSTGGSVQVNISQFGMSMVQSVLVCNEANPVAITVNAGQTGVPFGIQPLGTQMIPVYMKGTLLNISVSLNAPAPSAIGISFQIFNTAQPPASWVSNLAVNGNVNIATITGTVAVNVQNAVNIVGAVAITSGNVAVTGPVTISSAGIALNPQSMGCNCKLVVALSTTVTLIKAAAAVFKGMVVDNTGAAAFNYVQIFNAASIAAVTLGTTVPQLSYVAASANQGQGASENLPPEGIAFTQGICIAATTTVKGSTAPVVAPNVNIYFY